jgi:hypothetical protein
MNANLDDLLNQLHQAMRGASGADGEHQQDFGDPAWLQTADARDVLLVLRATLHDEMPVARWNRSLGNQVVRHIVHRQRRAAVPLDDELIRLLSATYRKLHSAGATSASHLLRLVATTGSRAALEAFAELVVAAPPSGGRDVLEIFSDLFRAPASSLTGLFPRLLDGLEHPQLAGVILDFCNYTVRSGKLAAHPARGRVAQLKGLLAQLAGRLGKIQETRPATDQALTSLGRQVTESVALAVSLCDALALIGDPTVAGNLYQAVEVEHRRLRVEAAAALVRLGEEPAIPMLLDMAADPSQRLRVLAYAEELELSDRLPADVASPRGRAEAELAVWLAEPTRFGVPPDALHLVAERVQYWPGFDDPLPCLLFRYEYELPAGRYANVGLGSPTVSALMCDLTFLSIDDLYAVFAGATAEHADIFTTDADQARGQRRVERDRWIEILHDAGYEDVEPELLGSFFGQRVLIATASRDQRPGVAIVTPDACAWFPRGNPQRPFGPEEAFACYVGRELLQAFNRD